MSTPALIIAGTHSGSGKTTVTLAVMSALARRGLRVQGYKVGPDFIDPGHHARVTGRPGRNLDTWLLDPHALASSFRKSAEGADIAVIEGAMGLFDGRGALDERGSSADLARLWDLPVVLVANARGLARSLAPLILGFATFDPEVRVAACVANKVGGRRHYDEYLAPALKASLPAVAPIGYLARDESLAIPSRHLGLLTAEELGPGGPFADRLADAAESTLDLNRLIALARVPRLPEAAADRSPSGPRTSRRIRLAVARDVAFCFYYEDNLDLLRAEGAEIIAFSPLDDPELPVGTQMVYLGGGYPELFADRLAANGSMGESIRRFHAAGGPILAECGGLLACAESLTDVCGSTWPMWNLIPARARMHDRFAALGYVTVETERDTLLGPAGTRVLGHEFHYSTLEPRAAFPFATRLLRLERDPKPDGILIGGLLAGYAHAFMGSNPDVARRIVASA